MELNNATLGGDGGAAEGGGRQRVGVIEFFVYKV